MIKTSAPGKIHISGEHAIVYGEPAIIASIDKRCFVNAEKSDKVSVSGIFECDISEALNKFNEIKKIREECLKSKNFSKLFIKMKNNYMKMISGYLIDKLNIGGFNINIVIDIPKGCGMGSSAAISASIAKAVTELYGVQKTQKEINEMAFEMESISNGIVSGGDNAAICYGNIIFFEDGKIKELNDLNDLEFLLVILSRPKKTTGELVNSIKLLDEGYRNKRIKEIGQATKEILKSLKNDDSKSLKKNMNVCQKNLMELKVSTKEIDELCDIVNTFGGGAKISGAGGGGAVICYHENLEELKEFLKSKNYESEKIKLGVEGVRIEN